MRIEIVHARDHMPEHYQGYLEGYRAVRLWDEAHTIRGELVWRVGSGHNIEITEIGLFQSADRRKGWGTQLLEAAIEDMRAYLQRINYPLWRIYLYCEERNVPARSFYEARGFHMIAILKDFYRDGNAMLYVRDMA